MTEAASTVHALERGARDARFSELGALGGARAREGFAPDARRLRVAHDVVADTLRALDRNRALAPAERNQKGGERSAAYLCAALSAWSYADAATLCDVAYRLGFGEDARCHPLGATNGALQFDAQAFYLHAGSGKLAVLVFRGAPLLDLVDRLTECRSLPAPDPGKHGTLNAGLAALLMPLWDPIVRFTGDPAARAEHLLVTGHGLGGALAAIAALTLCQFGHVAIRAPGQPRLAGVYSFGQPMLGDAEFAEWAEGQLGHLMYRYVHARDPIPRLPSRFEGQYRHFGMLHRDSPQGFQYRPLRPGTRAGREQALPAALAVLLAATGIMRKRVLPLLRVPGSLRAHSPAEYLALARRSVHPELAFP